jgi:hypothetical protein
MKEIRNTYKIVVGKFQGKRPFENPRRTSEDTVKMGLGIHSSAEQQ